MVKASVWAVMFMASAAWPGWGQATATVRINGSGSALSMLKPLAAAYQRSNPQVEIVVGRPLGSSGAVKALLAGALDIAMSGKPLKAEEASQGARLFAYGRTPLAIVAEREVPVTDLSSRQLEDIFAGRTTHWPGGQVLRLVLRPEADVDTQILRELSPAMNQAVSLAQGRPGMLLAITDPEATALVSRTQGGCGLSGLASVLEDGFPLKVLTLNGISPTPAALAGGTYPMAKDIFVVIPPRTSPAARGFLAFIYSKPGRALAQKAGVWVTATTAPDR